MPGIGVSGGGNSFGFRTGPFDVRQGNLTGEVSGPPANGWLQVHLVRRTMIQRLRTAAMWNLGQPILVTAISTFMPHPPMLTLQAVNRSSTY